MEIYTETLDMIVQKKIHTPEEILALCAKAKKITDHTLAEDKVRPTE